MAGDPHIEVHPAGDGEFSWRARSANGSIIFTAHETYVDEDHAYEMLEQYLPGWRVERVDA